MQFSACDILTNCPGHLEGIEGILVPRGASFPVAGVAQVVEHLICNQRVRGSNPFASSSIRKSGSEIQHELPAGSRAR